MRTTKPSPSAVRAIRLLRTPSPWGMDVKVVMAARGSNPNDKQPVAVEIRKKRLLVAEPLVVLRQFEAQVGRGIVDYIKIEGDVEQAFFQAASWAMPEPENKNPDMNLRKLFIKKILLRLSNDLKTHPHWFDLRLVSNQANRSPKEN
jgi:hypothetical protein